MEVEKVNEDKLNEQNNQAGSPVPTFDIRSEEFKRKNYTGRFEEIDGQEYRVHENYNEEKCFNDTARTDKIVHVKEPADNSSFWLSLCSEHLKKVKTDTRLQVIEERDPIRGEQ